MAGKVPAPRPVFAFPVSFPQDYVFPFRLGYLEGKLKVSLIGGAADVSRFGGYCSLPWSESGKPGGDPYAHVHVNVPGEELSESEALKSGFVKVLMHELMELSCIYLAKGDPSVVLVPGFQNPEYHSLRRTFVLQHCGSFSDACDLVAGAWHDLLPGVLDILMCLTPNGPSAWADMNPNQYYSLEVLKDGKKNKG